MSRLNDVDAVGAAAGNANVVALLVEPVQGRGRGGHPAAWLPGSLAQALRRPRSANDDR